MIMYFTQDHIKSAFLRRADTQLRTQIAARNSERRYYVCCRCVVGSFISYLLTYACLFHIPITAVFELLSDLWNDRDFNPIAPLSECHSDNVTSTDCSFARVAHLRPATPQQKMLNSFTTMRTERLRIIGNWERSGQGEGGVTETDEQGVMTTMRMTSTWTTTIKMCPEAGSA